MPLPAGTRLGPYEIQSMLGAGGMGEVYRARDTRLDRTVAIKVSAQRFSDRVAREAKAISAFSHPNICTLYDIGNCNGTDFLVMEHLEGETLAERLANGRLPIGQALEWAIQIAKALDVAHRQGIVHRDLKPGNVMLTKTGVKLLDFGLAKLIPMPGAQPSDSRVATEAILPATAEGSVLGTLPYMAPEQVEGKPADARTDMFAFGAVLYEMLTGRRAFSGKSQASLIGAIMTQDPAPPSSVQPMNPSALDRVVHTCVAKDPENRWQSARDLVLELEGIAAGSDQTQTQPPPVFRKRERAAWAITAILMAALVALGALYLPRKVPDAPSIEFTIPLPPDASSFSLGAPSVSPDGRLIAFRAIGMDGLARLWLRSVDSSAARPLPETTGVVSYFWSPNCRYIAFLTNSKLNKIDLQGGPPSVLYESPAPNTSIGGTWSRDGQILFTAHDGLYRLSSNNGPPQREAPLDSSMAELFPEGPHFLPDSRHFLFTIRSARAGQSGIYLGTLQRTGAKLLIHDGVNGLYVSPHGTSAGYILFSRQLSLMAQSFDAARGELSGEPFPVGPKQLIGAYGFDASANGVLAYRSGALQNLLVWVDRQGRRIQTIAPQGDYRQMSISPDESTLAVSRLDGDRSNIWLIDLAVGRLARLTSTAAYDWYPVWSPDGKTIVFSATQEGPLNLYQRPATGADADEPVLRSSIDKSVYSYSPDGRFIAYWSPSPNTQLDLWILPLFGDRQPFAFLQTEYNELQPEFSPNGQWIAYTSDESGRQEVYVRAFEGSPASGRKWRISTNGGSHSKWRRDGKELFYLAPDGKLMSVAVKSESEFSAGVPEPLFQTRVRVADYLRGYEVAKNGERFLLNTPLEEVQSSPITVIFNWKAGARD